MNPKLFLIVGLAVFEVGTQGQPASSSERVLPSFDQPLVLPEELQMAGPPPEALRDWQSWTVTAREESATTRQFTYPLTNALTGEVTRKVLSIIEVGAGMNYLDTSEGKAQWRETLEVIQLTENGGAAAVFGPTKVYFSPDLSSESAITVITKSNRVFMTHPTGIYYFDPTTQKSIELARVNPHAAAEVLPPNQVVWRSAFDSDAVKADFVVTYGKGGIEADVVYNSRIRPPETYWPTAVADRVQLQVKHTFTAMPVSGLNKRELGQDSIDEVLDIGEMRFPTGRAFAREGAGNRAEGDAAKLNMPWSRDDTSAVPVGKHWEVDGDKTVLTESVKWKEVATKFDALPAFAEVDRKGEGKVLLAKAGSRTAARMMMASVPYRARGFVMDWQAVSSGGDFTFATYNGANTYYVSSGVSFSGTVTFQAGCVIKYAPGTAVMLTGSVVCQGTLQSPSVLTSMHDPLFGEEIPNSTKCPSDYAADSAIWYYSQGGSVWLSGLRIRYATRAIRIDTQNYCGLNTVAASVLEDCLYGVVAPNNSIMFYQNSSVYRNVTYPTSTSCSVNGTIQGQGTLQKHVYLQMLTTISGQVAPADLYLYTTTGSPDFYPTGHSPSSWLYGVYGYTSLSMSNTPATNRVWYQGGGTLISPRVAVTADHMGCTIGNGPNGGFVGREFRWIGTDGYHYVRTCIAQTRISDMAFLLMNEPLPSAVQWVKVVPQSVLNKAPFLTRTGLPSTCTVNLLPCITAHGNCPKSSYAYDWLRADGNTAIFTYDQWLAAGWGRGEPFGGCPYPGDSGQPVWARISNQLVLVGTWTTPTTAMWYGYDTTAVNAAIANLFVWAGLGTPYDQVTPANLSPWPDTN